MVIPFIVHHNNEKQYRNLCFHISPLVLKQKRYATLRYFRTQGNHTFSKNKFIHNSLRVNTQFFHLRSNRFSLSPYHPRSVSFCLPLQFFYRRPHFRPFLVSVSLGFNRVMPLASFVAFVKCLDLTPHHPRGNALFLFFSAFNIL